MRTVSIAVYFVFSISGKFKARVSYNKLLTNLTYMELARAILGNIGLFCTDPKCHDLGPTFPVRSSRSVSKRLLFSIM